MNSVKQVNGELRFDICLHLPPGWREVLKQTIAPASTSIPESLPDFYPLSSHLKPVSSGFSICPWHSESLAPAWRPEQVSLGERVHVQPLKRNTWDYSNPSSHLYTSPHLGSEPNVMEVLLFDTGVPGRGAASGAGTSCSSGRYLYN